MIFGCDYLKEESMLTGKFSRAYFRWFSECLLCSHLGQHEIANICGNCFKSLPRIRRCCPLCATPMASTNLLCGRCLQDPPRWQALVAACHYEPPISAWISALKDRGQVQVLPPLSALLYTAVEQSYARDPLIVVPLPAHWSKWLQRGFNPAEMLATRLAKSLNLVIDRSALQRRSRTPSQRGMKRDQRLRGPAGSFRCHARVLGKRILLVDDVVTTGATLRAATDALLNAGAASVLVATVARTPDRL